MKILLVQTSFLGDTVLSTPLIAALKKLYAGAELWMMTTKASKELVERDPLLAGVVVYDKHGDQRGVRGMLEISARLRGMCFDRAYSLHRSPRTAMVLAMAGIKHRKGFCEAGFSFLYHARVQRLKAGHDVERNLSLLSDEARNVELDGELRLFAQPEAQVCERLRLAPQALKRYAVLIPGSVWATKMWEWSAYRELGERLLGSGFAVLLLGAAGEEQVCNKVAAGLPILNLAGKTSVSELLSIISRASLAVCNDSMSLHVASAFKVPTVAVFCATSPAFGFGPWRNRATVVEKRGLACKPCSRHGGHSCPTGTRLCMTGVSASEVFDASKEVLTH